MQLDSKELYNVQDDTKSKVEFVFDDVSLKFSDIQKLKENTNKEYTEKSYIAQDIKQAAQIGGNILDKCYSEWTETRTIIADENKIANAWVVSGQKLNRYKSGHIGAVVFSKNTGEMFYIGTGIPVS